MGADYDYQSKFIIDNAWRLLSFQDKDVSSPSFGNFHYSFWRDKTSEFPDSRFQEAGATLGMLSSKKFSKYHNQTLPNKSILYSSFAAGLENLSNLQYKEGCFDEWYKGERGFAATEFTSIAYGLAGIILDKELKKKEKDKLIVVLQKAGNWLSKREDRIKSNHQAAAAAALSIIWKITKDNYFLDSAIKAMDNTLKRQKKEGWFPEIGGMDLGYSGVLLDYCMIFFWITRDKRPIKPMIKLINFILPHIHPDGSIAEESGICLNPYVSRLGLCLIAPHSEEASWILDLIENKPSSNKVFEPYLSDDLRFCRWSHLPLVSNILLNKNKSKLITPKKEYYPQGWTIKKESSIVSYHNGKTHIYISVAGGGVIRVFNDHKLIFKEEGIVFKKNKLVWHTKGYKIPRNIYLKDKILLFKGDLHQAKYSFPSFLSRLVLRILCINKFLSKLTRDMIDQYRLRSGTALNQSAGSISRGANNINFNKEVYVDNNKFCLRYEIPSKKILDNMELLIINYYSPSNSLQVKLDQNNILIIIEFNLLKNNYDNFSEIINLNKLKKN